MKLIPLLGTLLLALELAAGTTRPDVGIPPVNLSCYKCFKMLSPDQCAPVRCQPQDSVCISLIVLIYSKKKKETLISKDCARKCANTNSKNQWDMKHFTRATIYRQCCLQSLCNRAWAPHSILLPLGLRLLWALL
ncbi:lymphocyte antigen 6L [Suncus etruscus]|uniref:lymphocyte antigen 6L n=1 Tax=Suncus etruscus TaxID=109475 RepID=UPI00210FEB55|nr:lymphocyte antigen 6L [Suncus etruscus]